MPLMFAGEFINLGSAVTVAFYI